MWFILQMGRRLRRHTMAAVTLLCVYYPLVPYRTRAARTTVFIFAIFSFSGLLWLVLRFLWLDGMVNNSPEHAGATARARSALSAHLLLLFLPEHCLLYFH